MTYSQEIYDAARSRISNIDGSAIERVAFEQFDISYAKALLQEQIGCVGFEMVRPSVLYRPTISLDGNAYCALYGEDLMNGCAGFGRTVAEAMADFDRNWHAQEAPTPASVGTHPEGQDGEAGLVRSMGDAVREAQTPSPSPITPNGA